MKNLKLPIIKGKLPAAKHLSMDDYLKFVTFNLEYTLDRAIQRKRKRLSSVTKRFVLDKINTPITIKISHTK